MNRRDARTWGTTRGRARGVAAAMAVALVASVPGGAAAQTRRVVAEDRIAEAEVERVMRRVADREIAGVDAWPRDWQHAVLAMGVLAAYQATGESRYLAALDAFAARHRWLPGARHYHADDHAVAQVYLDLYRLAPDRRRVAGFEAALDRLIARPWRWSKRHQTTDYWWSDALFMSPPAVAKLAAITGTGDYLAWMDERWRAAYDALVDRESGLFFRDLRYRPGERAELARLSRGGKTFWLRGNAWVLAGLARLLDELPVDHAARPFYEGVFRDLAASFAERQGPDGLWRADLLAPLASGPGETSGSALVCYGLAWGIGAGLLDEGRYRPAVTRAWPALAGRVDTEGRLGWVQPPGAEPERVRAIDTAPYGAGALLLAASEVLELAGR